MIKISYFQNYDILEIDNKKYKVPFLKLKKYALLIGLINLYEEARKNDYRVELVQIERELWRLSSPYDTSKNVFQYIFNLIMNFIRDFSFSFIKKTHKIEIIKKFIEINTSKSLYSDLTGKESMFKRPIDTQLMDIACTISEKENKSHIDVLNNYFVDQAFFILDLLRYKDIVDEYYSIKSHIESLSEKSNENFKAEKLRKISELKSRKSEIEKLFYNEKNETKEDVEFKKMVEELYDKAKK